MNHVTPRGTGPYAANATMNCKFCPKSFSKGEHLRRHERSHTGARPFVCKDCHKSFARQDSLMRHARLHARPSSAAIFTPPPDPADSEHAPHALSDFGTAHLPSSAVENAGYRGGQIQDERSHVSTNAQQQVTPGPQFDFDLIWPDSEDLFNTLISPDYVNRWQIPLGNLQFPAVDTPPASDTSAFTPSSFDDRVESIDHIPAGGSRRAVHNVTSMVANLSSSMTDAVEATNITSVFLDECLHMFFVRFIPTFPVMHRATFIFGDCTPPLLLNAIAIGSLYLGPSDAVAKGEVLWRLAHTAITTSWQTLITHRGPYDACDGVQLILTALLGQIYGVLSKNAAIRMTSRASHALGFFWARQSGMFDTEPFLSATLPATNAPEEEKIHQWRLWAARETQQRAALGLYILDGLIAPISGEQTLVRHASNQMCLPGSETVFEAGTADEWLSLIRFQDLRQPSFRVIFRLLFSVADELLGQEVSALSFRVLLEGLQSFTSDCDEDAEATVGMPTKTEIHKALARVYRSITQSSVLSTPDRLELLLRWHSVCLDAITSTSFLCNYVCARGNITQNILPKSRRPNHAFDLVAWASSPDGRRALLHAVAIQDIIEQLPRGRAHAIHMPSSLFAATTVYSVFSLAGLTSVKLPNTINWNEVQSTSNEAGTSSVGFSPAPFDSDTTRYIRDAQHPALVAATTTRNLLYEFNSIQKLFGCLSTQWGIARDMGNVVNQWTNICR